MKALPRLVAEEILGLLRDATRTERQIALAEMYRQSYEAVTRLCVYLDHFYFNAPQTFDMEQLDRLCARRGSIVRDALAWLVE